MSVPKGFIAGVTRAGFTRGFTKANGEIPPANPAGKPNPVVTPALIEKADVPAMGPRANDVGVATATVGGAIAGAGITAGAMIGG